MVRVSIWDLKLDAYKLEIVTRFKHLGCMLATTIYQGLQCIFHMEIFFSVVEIGYFSQQLYPSRNACRKVLKPVALRILEEIIV